MFDSMHRLRLKDCVRVEEENLGAFRVLNMVQFGFRRLRLPSALYSPSKVILIFASGNKGKKKFDSK